MTAVSIELPDEPGWSTVSVGGIRACAGGTPRPTDRGSRLTGSVESRPQGEVGEVHTVQVNDQEFHRVDVSWVDPQFGTIRQIHAFASLQREDSLQDFVHVTGSAGGAGVDTDVPLVEQVIASTPITR